MRGRARFGGLALGAASVLALLLLKAAGASGATIEAILPEFSGECSPTPCSVGTFQFTIPDGEQISAALLEGTFGNSGAMSSAPVDLRLDGVLVAQCMDAQPCTMSDVAVPWSHGFSLHELAVLADGMATLGAEQLGGLMVRLGETTLTITTVPEPSSGLLVALGLLTLAPVRRGHS
jgi:hypothetical protein